MKDQFDNHYQTPKKRTYFKGNKKLNQNLKNLMTFESFDINEVNVEATSARKLRVPKKFHDDIILACELANEIAEAGEKVKKLAKQLELVEDSAGGIKDTMEKYGMRAAKAGKILAELEKHPGKDTHSYVGMWSAVEKLIPEMQDALAKIEKANSHPAVEKLVMKYSIEESLKDDVMKVWDSIKVWFSTFAKDMKAMLPKFEQSVDDLEAEAEKMGALGTKGL